MLEDQPEVVAHRRVLVRREPGHRHLGEQVVQERPLRQDFHVEERGRRLGRDCRERRKPMEAAGRVNVGDGHSEKQPPPQRRERPSQPPDQPGSPPADDVVRMFHGRE
jgi:hypothetical protein